jgi:hypothetical protein
MHAIAFDKSKVWDKFCEFYDTVSGNSGTQGSNGADGTNGNNTIVWDNASARQCNVGNTGTLKNIKCKVGSTNADYYTYTPKNTNIVTVTSDGTYTGVGEGTTKITVKAYYADGTVMDTKDIIIYVSDPFYNDPPVGS